MEVQAFWVVAHNALEKGIAVLGRAETSLYLLACIAYASLNLWVHLCTACLNIWAAR